MDEVQFDRLTRRLVLGGLLGGALAAVPVSDDARAAKLSRRKRCKRKRRDFCDGRCCPKSRQCINKTCVESCNAPFQCPPGGPVDPFSCGPEDTCFCGRTPSGKSSCVAISLTTNCNTLPACGAGTQCPAGQVCFTCACDMGSTPIFRCAPPCSNSGGG